MKYTIAIDMGGTVVKLGLLGDGELLESLRLDAQRTQGFVSNLSRLKEAVNELLIARDISLQQLSGIGLAFPGLVDPNSCRVISTNEKYDDASSFDMRAWVRENWDVPFYMDNDARLAVVGEWSRGAAVGKDNVVMMTIGTGIGTGVILDGKVLYGRHFQAGSLGGHFVIDYKGRGCSCGNRGCVEAMASSFFLPAIIRQHPEVSDAFKEAADRIDFKALFSLADEGEANALLLRNECLDVWSAAVVSYIHAYDPEVVVLGGGVMKRADLIIPYVKEKVDSLAWCPSENVPIVAAQLADHAALYGLLYGLR
ncbi:MAG: ROK family protein [Tannerellaceae bacterium]|jgi:glucokinase|nr:ROK family protein [Tannerellaceae bacterium]